MGKVYSVKDNSKEFEDSKRVSYFNEEKTMDKGLEKVKNEKKETLTIDFSLRLMFFVILILAFIFFARQLITVILFLFFGFVIMSTVRPVVNWLRKRGISKGLSIGLAYIFFFLVISTVLVIIFVPFINQLAALIVMIPDWIMNALESIEEFTILGTTINFETVSQYINDILKDFPTAANVKNVAAILS